MGNEDKHTAWTHFQTNNQKPAIITTKLPMKFEFGINILNAFSEKLDSNKISVSIGNRSRSEIELRKKKSIKL